MPTPMVVGNWKMNTTIDEAAELAVDIRDGSAAISGIDLVLCPPFLSLAAVGDAVRNSAVSVGAQNMHYEDSGAFTGEIAPGMLEGVCGFVILGHSERRQLFGETDELVNRKVQAAFQHGIRPILCVGETLEQREGGQAQSVVAGQVRAALDGVVDITGLVVAYEPIWAIGTGLAATPEIAAEIMGGSIRQALTDAYAAAATQVPLLYGGSVNPGNVEGFAAQSCVHGALVGGASLRADQFLEIARLTVRAKG